MTASAIKDVASMAFRNLARHRVKTVITTTAVTISVALYIFMDAWLLGMNLDSRRNIVSYEMGAAKIQTKEYFAEKDDLPMYWNFRGWERISAKLSAAGYDSAPRFVFAGTLYSRSGSAPMVFNAVDFPSEGRVLRYGSYLEAGRLPFPGKLELAVGTLAADKLRVGIPRRISPAEFEEDIVSAAAAPGDEAFIRSAFAPSSDGKMLELRNELGAGERNRLWNLIAASGRMDVRISTVIDIREESGTIRHVNQLIDAAVTGVVNSPNPKTNGNIAFAPMDALQDEAGLMLEGKATELLVRLAGADDSRLPGKRETAAAISGALAAEGLDLRGLGLEAHGWKDYVADYIAASAGDQVNSRIMIILLFVLSFIGIANTMLMAILERTKETGMLRALGMTDRQLVAVYALEAGMIGAIGSLAGMIIGCLVNIPMVVYGIDYSGLAAEMGGDYGYRIAAYFRSAWNPLTVALSAVVATAVSAATAIPPTLRALKMPVTDCLRFE